MSGDPDRLFKLLPAVYRIRDAGLSAPAPDGDLHGPLKDLLRVIQEQVDAVEGDIRCLYGNWFIETCADWAVPYLAQLIGYEPLPTPYPTHEAGGPRLGPPALVARRDVADTVSMRTRKGTVEVLEELGPRVSGWPARAVEGFRLTGFAQSVRALVPERGRTVRLSDTAALDRVGTPFDRLGHTVNLSGPTKPGAGILYDGAGVTLFVWRLTAQRVAAAPAHTADDARRRWRFSVLGNDVPLLTRPVPPPDGGRITDELNVPGFVSRAVLAARTGDWYGSDRSFCIWTDKGENPVPLSAICAADLSRWHYRPPAGKVAVDPELGRIAFGERALPEGEVTVSYGYATADDIGGGSYPRPQASAPGAAIYRVGASPGDHQTIGSALAAWSHDKGKTPGHDSAVIEIADGRDYREPLSISLEVGERLEVRAATGMRPSISPCNEERDAPRRLRIEGPAVAPPGERRGRRGRRRERAETTEPASGPAPELTLNGLLIHGAGLEIGGRLERVTVRDCTLVPGVSLTHRGAPRHRHSPSIEVDSTLSELTIDRSIAGAIRVRARHHEYGPTRIAVGDSVIDALGDRRYAICDTDEDVAFATLALWRSTVLGRLAVRKLELAENCILDGTVAVEHRQHGCVRFCYLSPGSRTPPRHCCQPAPAAPAAWGERHAPGRPAPPARRVAPHFMSTRYGSPNYCRLAYGCPPEISAGADDGAELGVYHDLYQPQRIHNLTARLAEYAPATVKAAITFAT